jgi:NTP pyrophosphatase (non-canonical NTP hydrolase)
VLIPRPILSRFASLMEQKLQENDYNGGWDICSTCWLGARLVEEVGELLIAISESHCPDEIKREAADVANFAMMLADKVGGGV